MTQNIAALYEGYCYDAVYPRHIGGFIGWLKREHGWEVLSESNSGPRIFDRWVVEPPKELECSTVTVTSWTDGEVRIEAGGWTIMTNRQYREIYTRIEKMYPR